MHLKTKEFYLPHENNKKLLVKFFGSKKTATWHIEKHFRVNSDEVTLWRRIISNTSFHGLVAASSQEKNRFGRIKDETLNSLYEMIVDTLISDLAWVFNHPMYLWFVPRKSGKNLPKYQWYGLVRAGYMIFGKCFSKGRYDQTIVSCYFPKRGHPRDPFPVIFDYSRRKLLDKASRDGRKIEYLLSKTWKLNQKSKKPENAEWKKMLKNKLKMSENFSSASNSGGRKKPLASCSLDDQMNSIFGQVSNKKGKKKRRKKRN